MTESEQSVNLDRRWWISTGPLARGGRKVLGPFADQELALKVRTYVEKAENRDDLWVDEED